MKPLTGAADPLADLHGLALPPAPGGWPPAPGWWLVMISLLALIAVLYGYWRQHQRREPVRARARAVSDGIKRLQALADAGDVRRYAVQADQLIRQVARVRFGFDGVSLSGRSWQQWLGEHAPEEYKAADWQLLADYRYRKELPPADLQALHRQCSQWLEHNKPC